MIRRIQLALALALPLLVGCSTVEPDTTEAQIKSGDWMAAKAEIYRELAVRSLRGGDPDRTRRLLAEALQFENGDVRSIQLLARLSLAAGELMEAQSYTQWWLRLEPESIPALLLAGIIAESQSRNAEAEAYFLQAHKLDADDPRPLVDLHTFYLNRGRLDEATTIREDLLRRFPNCHEVLLDQAAYLESKGKWNEALEYFQEARRLRPDDMDLAARLGTTALLGNRNDVVLELDETLPPHARLDDVALVLVLSAARLRAGNEEGVLQELELLEGNARKDPVIAILRAEILLKRRDLVGAEVAFREALAQDNQIARAYGGLGRVHLLRGQTDAARRSFQRAVELAPRSPENRALLAACLAQVGDMDNAREHLVVARASDSIPRLIQDVERRFPQLVAPAMQTKTQSEGDNSNDGN